MLVPVLPVKVSVSTNPASRILLLTLKAMYVCILIMCFSFVRLTLDSDIYAEIPEDGADISGE